MGSSKGIQGNPRGDQGWPKEGPRGTKGYLWASKGVQGGPRRWLRAPSGTRAFANVFFRALGRSLLGHQEIIEKPHVLQCFGNLRDPWGNLGGTLGGPWGSQGGLGGDLCEPRRVLGVPGGGLGGPGEPLWGSWGALGGAKGFLGGSWGSLLGLLGHRKIIEKPCVLLCFRNMEDSGDH